MTLRKLVNEIENSLPDDYKHIDKRLIIRVLNEQRAIWLKNQFNQNRSIDNIVKQSIYVDVKLVNRVETVEALSKDNILKSTVEIPETLNRHHKDTIMSVSNYDILSEKYNYITKEQAIYSGNGFTNRNKIFCFLYKDHLFIKTTKSNPKINLIKKVVIEGVFEDPVEAFELNNNTDSFYMEYPIPITSFTYIKQNIINDLTGVIQAKQIEEANEQKG